MKTKMKEDEIIFFKELHNEYDFFISISDNQRMFIESSIEKGYSTIPKKEIRNIMEVLKYDFEQYNESIQNGYSWISEMRRNMYRSWFKKYSDFINTLSITEQHFVTSTIHHNRFLERNYMVLQEIDRKWALYEIQNRLY